MHPTEYFLGKVLRCPNYILKNPYLPLGIAYFMGTSEHSLNNNCFNLSFFNNISAVRGVTLAAIGRFLTLEVRVSFQVNPVWYL
jgi:hypothetical protein